LNQDKDNNPIEKLEILDFDPIPEVEEPIPEVVESTEVNQSESDQKENKNKTKIILISLFLFVILSLSATGSFFLMRYNSKQMVLIRSLETIQESLLSNARFDFKIPKIE